MDGHASVRLLRMLLCVVMITALACEAAAAQVSDAQNEEARAVQTRVVKVVWDIKVRTSPQVFKAHLEDIREAYDELVRQNIEPEMVFLFHGPSVRLVTRKQTSWSRAAIEDVTRMLADFQKLKGVRMEADPVALKTAEKEARNLLPGIKPIKNGFVALIEYQAQGYATISLE